MWTVSSDNLEPLKSGKIEEFSMNIVMQVNFYIATVFKNDIFSYLYKKSHKAMFTKVFKFHTEMSFEVINKKELGGGILKHIKDFFSKFCDF